jgi:asparagine synthase (glutamine-hydrolysing)
MCGIAGQLSLAGEPLPHLSEALSVMNRLLQHRGPDGEGIWQHPSARAGFAHRRLSIIDLDTGAQPMRDPAGNWITYNGEIYNYVELRQELGVEQFRTTSDTEVILRAYEKWGADCVPHLRGMFAFALWDEARQRLFCARDRFGIKPFYYAVVGDVLLFASEVKALLPFLPAIETDLEGLKDYLAFQFCLAGKTLFQGVRELPAGHTLSVERGVTREQRYWEVYYDLDLSHTTRHFQERLLTLLEDSTRVHLRADVPIGAYISGGLDSSIVASLASQTAGSPLVGFTGKFLHGPDYDETQYARALAEHRHFPLHEIAISGTDFVEHIRKVIYHLDYPVAGPGSFPQYMVSELASRHRKVVLGGQGGDEIFGGYARYLIAYFEQCIKAAIDGTMRSGNFVVTYESIIPNLTTLRSYKPLLQEFWREGLFEPMDKRYFRLINRSGSLDGLVDWTLLGDYSPFETFRTVFHGSNVGKESYFDQMTHFDFKTLLPALLHVEDRVSMAHGLESRVPLLDHPIVELAATAPADIKFKDGHLKHLLRNALGHVLPPAILNRTDKMGFPTPLTEFVQTDARQFVQDVFSSKAARQRTIINNARVLEGLADQPRFSRKLWGLLSLELWQQEFHDRQAWFKGLINEVSIQGQIT